MTLCRKVAALSLMRYVLGLCCQLGTYIYIGTYLPKVPNVRLHELLAVESSLSLLVELQNVQLQKDRTVLTAASVCY